MACCLGSGRVCVKENDVQGRFVRAERVFSQGEVVFENVPTAQLLLTSLWGDRCMHCFSAHKKIFRCTKCKHASYCSRDCQTKDWSQHKIECKHIPKLWGFVDQNVLNEAFILLRLHGISKNLHENCIVDESSLVLHCGQEHVSSLHVGTPETDLQDDYSQVALHIAQQITERDMAQLTVWLRQFRSNNFGVTDELVNCIGMGVYPAAALLNHSCAPNCLLRYRLGPHGAVVQIVAARDITAGEELTHSYVDCSLPREMRRTRLRDVYGFACHCSLCEAARENDRNDESSLSRCVEEYLRTDSQLVDPLRLKTSLDSWRSARNDNVECVDIDKWLTQTLSTNMPWDSAELAKSLQQIDAELTTAEDDLHIQDCLTRLQEVETIFSKHYGVFHVELHKLRGKILTAQLLLLDFDGARRYCAQIVTYLTLSLLNVPCHALLGVQLFTLGDLTAHCGRKEAAKALYEWCRQILTVTHIAVEEITVKLLENIAQLDQIN